MGCRPPPFEYSGNTQNECAGANRGNILCSTRLPTDELYCFAIADSLDDTVGSAGDTTGGRRRGYPHAEIDVTEINLNDADFVLGIDFLGSQRVWISYGSQQLFLMRRI